MKRFAGRSSRSTRLRVASSTTCPTSLDTVSGCGTGSRCRKMSEGPIAVGSTFATTAKAFGTQREQSTVTELTPTTAFAWDSTGALGRAHHSFALSEDGGTTKLTKTAQIVEPKP